MKRWMVVAVIALIGCKKSSQQPAPTASGSASGAAPSAGSDAPAATAWELRSKPIELDCGPQPLTGSYKAALDAGRVAGKAKKWAEAVAAFEHALTAQADDPAALGELAWATLQIGDATRALELAERALEAAGEPNAQAANHFNAARAAEALGDVTLATRHYMKSLELRPNDAILGRLEHLDLPPPRRVPQASPLIACQRLASVDAVCTCLATSVAEWGKAGGIEGAVTCEPSEARGTQAQLVAVTEQPADPDSTTGGTALVLVAKHGATWSAWQVVETADAVDRSVTPKAMHTTRVNAYEERGTTVWVETQNQFSETGGGEREVRGDVGLTICSLESPGLCTARIPLASWDYTQTLAHGQGEDTCEVRTSNAYRATLTSAGVLTLVLAAGVDEDERVGRYQR